MKDSLLALSDIVKGKIVDEMKNAKHGTIIHDGWTLPGVHYIRLFSCYIIQRKTIESGKIHMEDVTVATLISCVPMSNIDASDEVDTDTAPVGDDNCEERRTSPPSSNLLLPELKRKMRIRSSMTLKILHHPKNPLM